MPVVEMPNGDLVEFPDDVSSDVITGFVKEKFPEVFPKEKGEFSKGFSRSVETLPSLVADGLPALGKSVVNKVQEELGYEPSFDPTEDFLKFTDTVQKANEKNPAKYPSFRDVKDLKSLGGYVAGAAGEAIPSLVTSMGSGAAGSLIAKSGIKAMAKKAGKTLTDKEVSDAMIRGAVIGGTGAEASQVLPESYFNLLEKGVDDPLTAIAAGSLKASIGFLPQAQLFKKILGPQSSDIIGDTLLKRFASQAAITGAQEGLVEGAQTGIDLLAEKLVVDPNMDFFSPVNVDNLIDSTLKGVVGGAIGGGGASFFMSPASTGPNGSPKINSKKYKDLENRFEEEVISPSLRDKASIDTSNIMDDSVMPPLVDTNQTDSRIEVSPESINYDARMNNIGMQKESILFLDPEKDGITFDAVEQAVTLSDTATDIFEVGKVPTFRDDKGRFVKSMLQTRQKEIAEGKPTQITEFISGDGVISVDTPRSEPKASPDVVISEPPQPKQPKPRKKNPLISDKSTLRPVESPFSVLQLSDTDKTQQLLGGTPNPKPKKKVGKQTKPVTATPQAKPSKLATTADNDANVAITPTPTPAAPVRAQRALPKNGSLETDYLLPQITTNNLKKVALTPRAKVQNAKFIKGMQRIADEIFGPGKVTAEVYADLVEEGGLSTNYITGAQFMNTVAVSLNPNVSTAKKETLYHEIWHQAERFGLVPDADKHTDKLIDFYQEDNYLTSIPFEELLRTRSGREEIRANAFGKWAAKTVDAGKLDGFLVVPDAIPSAFHAPYRKLMNMLRKTKNMLNGNGFNSFEDVFVSLYSGERADRPLDVLENINYHQRTARLQKMAKEYQDVLKSDLEATFKNSVRDGVLKANSEWDAGKRMGLTAQWLGSFAHMASKNPAITPAYDSLKRRIQNYNAILSEYQDTMRDFTESGPELRYRIHELMDYNDRAGQKAKVDNNGFLTFERDGYLVKLKDKDVSAKYMQLQKAYEKQVDDYANFIRTNAATEFNVTPDFSFQQLDVLLADENITPSVKERLENLKGSLADLQRLKQTDYVPRKFFGDYAITVRNKDGNQVDFFTFETSGFLDRKLGKTNYNPVQLQNALKILKENYGDTTKFDIIGGDGTIKNLNSPSDLKPFKLTYNSLKDNIDPSFLNIEVLSGLLHSDGIDPKDVETLHKQIYNDVLTKGFKNNFVRRKLDTAKGYSRDWDRVLHSSFSGTASFLSGLPHKKELAAVRKTLPEIKDKGLRDTLESYLDYSESGLEDFQMLRNFNFMWAMGGNLSTALLQFYTLPTITTGLLNAYNPNIIDNIGKVGKWMGIAKDFAATVNKTVYANDGMLFIDFADSTVLEKLVNKKTIRPEEAAAIKKFAMTFRGGLAEDLTGFHPFETKSFGGSIKRKMSKTGYFLGLPIALSEQITRFATTMSAMDTFLSNNGSLDRAKKVLADDYRFQAQIENNTNMTYAENLALFLQDEAHSAVGKHARPRYLRGAGGGIFFPFVNYQHQMLELLTRLYGRGTDGKRALGVILSSMMLFAGLMGLPGAALLKEMYELIEKELTGTEEDLDLVVREKIYENTGSVTAGKFVTQGFGRAFLNLDAAKRLGLGVPGTDLFLMLTGAKKGDTLDIFGVAGSILPSMANAFNAYNNDAGFIGAVQQVLPPASGNLVKAADMINSGIRTQKGEQLILPDDIKNTSVVLKAIGFNSDQNATARELLYYNKVLGNQKLVKGIDRYRAKAKQAYFKYDEATRKGDLKKAAEYWGEYQTILTEYIDFNLENGVPEVDVPAFNRSVMSAARQRETAEIDLKSLRRHQRLEYEKIKSILGAGKSNE